MSMFEKNLTRRYIVNFVTKTSRDIGGACGNGAIGYRRILP